MYVNVLRSGVQPCGNVEGQDESIGKAMGGGRCEKAGGGNTEKGVGGVLP